MFEMCPRCDLPMRHDGSILADARINDRVDKHTCKKCGFCKLIVISNQNTKSLKS